MKKIRTFILSVMVLSLAACAAPSTPAKPTITPPVNPTFAPYPLETPEDGPYPEMNEPDMSVLTVMTHDSFAISDDALQKFEEANDITVEFLQSGDTGAAINRAVLTKAKPAADIFYGVDNSFLSRALDEGIFEPYKPSALSDVPDEFKLDPTFQAVPVDYGDVCLNYDKAYFAEKKLAVPQSFEDLLKPEYRGMLVTENPATSSPGLAFFLASAAHFGADKVMDYWKSLRNNALFVTNDWETAYYGNFSGSSGRGDQPLVVSYATSPAAELIFADPPVQEPPTAVITAPGMCYRQIEFVGILKGTPKRAMAEKFVDFLLSQTFQEDLSLQMFVYPVRKGTTQPEAFQKFGQSAKQPASLPAEQIAKNREAWIETWNQVVIK